MIMKSIRSLITYLLGERTKEIHLDHIDYIAVRRRGTHNYYIAFPNSITIKEGLDTYLNNTTKINFNDFRTVKTIETDKGKIYASRNSVQIRLSAGLSPLIDNLEQNKKRHLEDLTEE